MKTSPDNLPVVIKCGVRKKAVLMVDTSPLIDACSLPMKHAVERCSFQLTGDKNAHDYPPVLPTDVHLSPQGPSSHSCPPVAENCGEERGRPLF